MDRPFGMMSRFQTRSALVWPNAIWASYWPMRRAPCDLDPLPAFDGDLFGCRAEFLGGQAIEQDDVLEPAPVIILEEIAQDYTACGLIGLRPDEPRAAIRGPDGAFGELAADQIRLLVVGLLNRLPDLLLTGMVIRDSEGHELLQRHAILGIDVEELFRDRDKTQPLLHHRRRDEETGGDLFVSGALVAQRLEGAELIEGMQSSALDVFGERILFRRNRDTGIANYVGDRRGLGQALLLDQKFKRPVAAAACGDLEHAGLGTIGVENRADAEALQERAPGDVLGQLLDRDAGLQTPHVGLAEHQLVEGNVARGAEGDLLNGLCHVGRLRDGWPGDSLSTSNPSRKPGSPFTLCRQCCP